MFTQQKTIEDKTETNTKQDEEIETALKIWQEYKDEWELNFNSDPNPDKIYLLEETYQSALTRNLPSLSQAKLQILLDTIKPTHPFADKGIYLSALIQTSYRSGQSEFRLHCKEPIDNFLRYVAATKENPLNVMLYGTMGDFIGINSANLHITNYGIIGDGCADGSENTIITNHGAIKDFCAANSKSPRIINYGTIGDYCGDETTLIKITNPGTIKRITARHVQNEE